jgi:2-methylcitrate dehydratase
MILWTLSLERSPITLPASGLPIFITQARKSCEPEKWDPRTRETADHSLPYIFARALVDGPIRVSSFEDEAVRDPALRPIMAKIKVIPDDAIEAMLPEKTLLRAVATTHDGTRHTCEIVNPLGHPDNPMQDRDIEEKFTALAEPVLGAERSRAAWERWRDVTRSADLARLLELLDLPDLSRFSGTGTPSKEVS